jgi:hypothetical protein
MMSDSLLKHEMPAKCRSWVKRRPGGEISVWLTKPKVVTAKVPAAAGAKVQL